MIDPHTFSITAGGPFYRLGRRVGLVAPSGEVRIKRLVAFAWLPLLAGAVIRLLIGDRPEPLIFDLSVHTRFLVALPLLVLAGLLFDTQVRAAAIQLYDGNYADSAALDRVFERAGALRDNPWVEGALGAIALTGGQLVLWGVTGPTGLFHGIDQANLSISQVWYAAIALPLVQFLAVRWLWRWVIWTMMLVQLARLPLATIATHPDRAAGLKFLSGPMTAFAVFELAFASLLASVWGTQLADGHATVPSLLPALIVFVVAAFLVATTPLLIFCPYLFRAQRQALLVYHPFSLEYVQRFHAKWIEHRTDDERLLGTPDIQSFADLDNMFQIIEGTRLFVFSTRKLTELWLAAILPCLPLALTVVPLDQVFKRIGSMLFGGLL